jgi:CMP-N,N'-diacetyllegionaminic acid synthase
MKYLAVIPARGGSKGIPGKNIVSIAGKPLIAWTIEAALGCSKISKIVVSTDCEDIASVVRELGVEVIARPIELSQDTTPTAPVLVHAYNQVRGQCGDFDAIITLQPTSPLRKSHHLSEAIELFEKFSDADSLVSVTQVPHHMVPNSLMEIDGVWGKPVEEIVIMRRQDKPIYWCRNGAAVYITKSPKIEDYVWGGKTLVYPMDKISSLDIDDQLDLKIAEALLKYL